MSGVTDNLIQQGETEEERLNAIADVATANGWALGLQAEGEKSLSRSVTLGGDVYFTTFAPGTELTNMCEPAPGTARIYTVNLCDATSDRPDYKRLWSMGPFIPETVSPFFGWSRYIFAPS